MENIWVRMSGGRKTEVIANSTMHRKELMSANSVVWLQQFRRWLRYMENEMNEAALYDSSGWFAVEYLEMRLLEQQVFQTEIERDGAILVATIRKYINGEQQLGRTSAEGEDTLRCKATCLEHRWHDLWLKSLERQCRLEQRLRSIQLGLLKVFGDSVDRAEPIAKRPRLDADGVESAEGSWARRSDSVTSDTIPFPEDEYESIMDGTSPILDDNGNVVQPADEQGAQAGAMVAASDANEDCVSNRSAMADNCDEIRDSKESEHWTANSQHVAEAEEGHSSENYDRLLQNEEASNARNDECSMTGQAEDGLCGNTPSASDSSPYLERRRIENNPSYYKITQCETDGATDTDTPRLAAASPDPHFRRATSEQLETSRSKSPNPLLTAPVQSTPVLQHMDDPFDQCNDYDDVLNLFNCGMFASATQWKPFRGGRFSTPKQPVKVENNCPSCDASSEMSMDESRDKENEWSSSSKTLLQSGEYPATNSLRRRRKRPLKQLPPSVSETAIMSMSFSSYTASPSRKLSTNLGRGDSSWMMTSSMSSSGYGGGGTGNESWSSGWKRKKLRVRRMPRSMSDGEHLSFFNRRYRYSSARDEPTLGNQDGAEAEHQFPSAPRGTPTSDSNEDGRSEFNAINEVESLVYDECGMLGCGDTMAALDEVADDGERTAGDGGSTASGADQSETGEMLWDEYKPRNHDENGPPDQPALDGTMLTTFGDDYRSYFGQTSDSCGSAGPASARMTKDNHDGMPFSLSRLPPIGVSHDSDSELEGSFHLIKESQRQLRSTLKQYQKHRNQPRNGPSLIDLLPTCEKNVGDLEKIFANIRQRGAPLGRTASLKNTKDLAAVEGLLKDWKKVLLMIRQQLAGDAPLVHDDSGIGPERQILGEAGLGYLLQKELSRLRASLQKIFTQGALRTARRGGGLYNSLEETQEDIDCLKTLRKQLAAEKAIVKSYDVVANQYECGHEISQLRTWFEEACLTFDKQLRELETLREYWMQWTQTELACRLLLGEVESKLGENGAMDHSSRCDDSPGVASMKRAFSLLEERVARLETLCNEIASSCLRNQPSIAPSVDQPTLAGLQDRTAFVRRERESLRGKIAELEKNEQCAQPNARDDEDPKTNVETECECREVAAKRLSEPTLDDGGGAPLYVRLWFWPVQLCLLILLLLDVFFCYPSCCERMNRYWWSLGPKVSYAYGPPPT